MIMKTLPPVEYLRKRLRYEPETGKLFWRDCEDMPLRWRKAWAEKPAFMCLSRGGYFVGNIDGKLFLAHRIVWAVARAEHPCGQIDHFDHDKTNNRIENLRIVTHQQNGRNQSLHKSNTSGVCGVRWDKTVKKWRARIRIGNYLQHLGYFELFDDAVSARNNAELKHGFCENHGLPIEQSPHDPRNSLAAR